MTVDVLKIFKRVRPDYFSQPEIRESLVLRQAGGPRKADLDLSARVTVNPVADDSKRIGRSNCDSGKQWNRDRAR